MKYEYDITIIGAGSGGVTAASMSAFLGAKVLLIESKKMGGDCLNYGCVPSKTFLKSTNLAKHMKDAGLYGLENTAYDVSISGIMDRVKKTIEEIAPNDSKQKFEEMGVSVKLGNAKITGKHEVTIGNEHYTSKSILIATGSSPNIPEIEGLSNIDYYTNETIFNLEILPKTMLIIGAGPISLEIGQGFAHLGVDVNIVDVNTTIFTKEEPEVNELMTSVLQKDKINFFLNSKVINLVKQDNEIVVSIIKDDIESVNIIVDTVFVATGRIANIKDLGLAKIGIDTSASGIKVNTKMQTNIPNIYACGDVIGKYQFTHTAGYEAIIAVKNSLIFPIYNMSYSNIPWTTFTLPQVSHVGLTEKQAKLNSVFHKSYIHNLYDNDRSKTDDDRNGFIKIILNSKKQVIGATIVGEKSSEILPLLSFMVTKKLKLKNVLDVMFQYPTQVEIIRDIAFQDFSTSTKSWQKRLIKKLVTR